MKTVPQTQPKKKKKKKEKETNTDAILNMRNGGLRLDFERHSKLSTHLTACIFGHKCGILRLRASALLLEEATNQIKSLQIKSNQSQAFGKCGNPGVLRKQF